MVFNKILPTRSISGPTRDSPPESARFAPYAAQVMGTPIRQRIV